VRTCFLEFTLGVEKTTSIGEDFREKKTNNYRFRFYLEAPGDISKWQKRANLHDFKKEKTMCDPRHFPDGDVPGKGGTDVTTT